MSDPRLATIGEGLGGAPDHLVERSAAARAAAQGIALDEVLNAWSGGAVITAPAAPSSPEPAPASTEEAPPEPVTAPVEAAPDPSPMPVTEPPALAAIEVAEEEPEPIDPAPMAERIRLGARAGAGLGAAMGLISLLVMAPLALTRLTQATAEGGPAVEITWTFVAAAAVVGAATGAVTNLFARGMGRFRSPAFDTEASPWGSVFSGGFSGLIVGAMLGGLVYATGEATLSDSRLFSVSAFSLLVVLVGWLALGASVGGIGQAIAQPAALRGEEAEEAHTVRKRITEGLALPILSTAVILVIVISFGSLLIRYASFAPLIAILVSIGIIGFSALMASRPNLRVTKGEFLVAAAGIGVVLTMLALVASAISEDEDHSGEEADHAIAIYQTDRSA
ncbi:MAG: hypothetical protein OXH10_08030 [bacterium]|nr:hypothetical protein [bacterium]